jgi:hypothetical protein
LTSAFRLPLAQRARTLSGSGQRSKILSKINQVWEPQQSKPTSLILSTRNPTEAVNPLANDRVALASTFFEALAVEDFYFAASVLDQAGLNVCSTTSTNLELKLGQRDWSTGGSGNTPPNMTLCLGPARASVGANLCQEAAAEGTYDGCGICASGLLLPCSPIFSPARICGAFLLGRRSASALPLRADQSLPHQDKDWPWCCSNSERSEGEPQCPIIASMR